MLASDGFAIQVDLQLLARRKIQLQRDGEQAVLQAVIEEDVSETGCDDDSKAVVGERPDGILAGGAAAEIVSGHQDLRALVGRLVEDERWIFGEVVKEVLAEAILAQFLQEARRNDLVRVDVRPRDRDGDRFERREALHCLELSHVGGVAVDLRLRLP